MNSLAKILREKKAAGQRLATLTAYDYVFGRLLDEAGLDFILVGDSLGMVQLGLPDTTGVTMADMLHHVRAVARGVKKTPLVADLPADAGSSAGEVVASARALLEAGAQAVKLEGGTERAEVIHAITSAGIPLIGHLGMLPQRVVIEGGYRVKGRVPEEAEAMVQSAAMLEECGAVAVVLELVAPDVAAQLSGSFAVPFIGIGSGPDCDGEILVTHDLVGLMPWFRPAFVRPEADLANSFLVAVQAYVKRTRGTGV
ncbi:MAG: 3-methyl-2-oxobutanoate hydroxymethyltransferase [Terrimicrobiaceae bacterium]